MNNEPNKSSAEQSQTGTIRTLLVDDCPFMLKTIALILAKTGNFTVIGAASNGRQAIEYTSASLPELVLMDFHMPYLNGAQVTRYLKQCINPPIVFILTSDDSAGARAMSETAGADAFIVKSSDLCIQLRSKLREWFSTAAKT